MNPSIKILLINNDKDLGEALAFQLPLGEKYQIIETSDETSALAQINNNFCDLVIINSQSSALKGYNLTKNLRLAGCKNPIIMLINQSCNLDIPNDQNHKADEYIIKPFRYLGLLKSIETQLHKFKKSENTQYNIGNYVFKPNSKILESNECISIRLTEKENNILKFLYKNSGNIVSRETLLHEVWGYNSKVTTHTLETHIYRLRQKIEDDPSEAYFLITEPGGYKLRHK
ncbi:response regulator transcription factor [Amylibacter sp.]|nr:response regulator transcription factor [Amylibacter sp.]